MHSVSRLPEILARIKISAVWTALGGAEPKRKRAPAIWRNTKDRNVALDDDKGTWYDHARGEGGGVLDLVQRARGCSRREAVRWLADFAGVPLDNKPLSRVDRTRWARARCEAKPLARLAAWWLQARMAELSDAKADAVSGGKFDVWRLAPAARELYRLERLSAESVLHEYLAAKAGEPERCRRLERIGRVWEEMCEAAIRAAVSKMAREAVHDAA